MKELIDVDSLVQAYQQGTLPKMLCFWRPDSATAGVLGPECLSQWHDAGFTLDGVRYKTAEHWMMAEKARLFGDLEKREQTIACDHPGEARKLGREVRGFDPAVWRDARSEIVTLGNVAKFGQNEALGGFLAASRGRLLVEASPRDRIWGIGLEANDPRTSNPQKWRGQNLLGFALMEARRRLETAAK